MSKTRSTRRASTRSITVLAYSENAQVMSYLRALLVELRPDVELRCARIVDDAARQGSDTAIDLALLDHSNGRRLSPLIRLVRRHSPNVKVVTFSDQATQQDPRITRWENIRSSIAKALD